MTWSRRRFLAAAAGGAAAAVGIDAFLVEPGKLTVTRHAVGAGGGPTARLVQLTDLHMRALGDHEHEVAAAVGRLEPDALLLTGDTIESPGALGLLGRFLDLLDPAVPKVAILGNWERWAGIDPARMEAVLAARNGRLLVNATTVLATPAGTLAVTGLDDLVEGSPDWSAATRGPRPGGPWLVLVHCPAYRDLLPAEAAPDVVLSGHTHGGQIAPFGWAPVRPRGSGRYVSGWYRGGGPPLYVSRGIGTVGIPARLGAPPEVAVFDWALG